MIKVYNATRTWVDLENSIPDSGELVDSIPVIVDHGFNVNDDIIVVEDMGAEKIIVVVPSDDRESIWQSEPCRIYTTMNLELVEKGEISYEEALGYVEAALMMSRFDTRNDSLDKAKEFIARLFELCYL